MTDRIRHLTVTLDADYRDDDAEQIISAIEMVRGVGDVQSRIVEASDLLARMSARADIERDLHEAIDGVLRRGQKDGR